MGIDVTPFTRKGGELHAEDVPLGRIAEQLGTPVYVYSENYFRARYHALQQALYPLDAQICYAVKANSNLSVLRCFHALGAGFDIVSGGELQRVLAAGGDPGKVVFSGVGKSEAEIDLALKCEIGCFNVESSQELSRISRRASLLGRVAPVSVRVNPDVDARTHPYISTGLKTNKFGVPVTEAEVMYRQASIDAALKVVGVDCHIGSQIGSAGPLLEALESLLKLVDRLADQGIELQHVDLGGGLGVSYRDEPEFDLQSYGSALRTMLAGRKQRLMLEPGRYLVANGGVLLTRVEYLKPAADDGRSFAIVDAAMNDLIRPALYQAWHRVEAVSSASQAARSERWDIVGPICESGDFLAHDRDLALAPDALLAVFSAGAYGMVQSSNYNSRPRPPEVMVDKASFRVIRRRETSRDLLSAETGLNGTEIS